MASGDEAPRAHFGQPYTVEDVQKEYNYWDTDYSLERIALPGDSPVTAFQRSTTPARPAIDT